MIYHEPPAYLLDLEGIALMDGWAGDRDRAFTDARLDEIRRLLDDRELRDSDVHAEVASTVAAYRQQSACDDLEAGAGCSLSTSRSWPSTSAAGSMAWRWNLPAEPAGFAEFLARHGHQVIGVDSSPRMLANARRRVPDGRFHLAFAESDVRPRSRHGQDCGRRR